MASDSAAGSNPPVVPGPTTLEQHLDSAAGSVAPRFLLVVHGQMAGRLCRVDSETFIIGRSGNVDLLLDDPSVSARHAKLIVKGDECWAVDLGSTNGTFINQAPIVGTAPLRVGDALRIGNVILAFLAEQHDVGSHTLSLAHEQSGTLTRTGSLRSLPMLPSGGVVTTRGSDADEGPSLLEWIQRIRLAWSYVRRHAWLLVALASLGIAGGVFYARQHPPPGAAWFEISLASEAQANPIERADRRADHVIFSAPQNAFRALPLVKRTLKKFHTGEGFDEKAVAIQGRLSFEPLDRWGKVWRGEYTAPTAGLAQEFLQAHLEEYLNSEISKTLQLLETQDAFLASQLGDAKAELTDLESRMATFREDHPEILPLISDVSVPSPKDKLGSSKASVSKSLNSTNAEIAQLKERLAQGDSLLADRVQAAEKYRKMIGQLETQIVQAKAEGLTERHPKIQKLKSQVRELEALEKKTVAAESTEIQKRTNREYRQMRERLAQLQREAASKHQQLKGLDQDIRESEQEKLSLPELETRYREMARQHENATGLYYALSQKKKANELQLEIERAAASSRYELMTPPTAELPNTTLNMLKWVAIGCFAGLFLAVLIAAMLELRWFLRQVTAMDPQH